MQALFIMLDGRKQKMKRRYGMKKKKISLLVLLVLCALLSLASCGNKSPLSAEDFRAALEDAGFIITDATEQFAAYDYVEKVYVAQSSDQTFQIEFYKLATENDADNFFATNREIFENNKGGMTFDSSVSVGNVEKYTIKSADAYRAVSRISDTVIYVNVDLDNMETVQEILEQLGY
jgi:uncharacterized lipoprotein YehR (DUF1307 family)